MSGDKAVAAKLYTPQILSLAMELAAFPPRSGARFHGSARSRTCGGTVQLDCDLDDTGIAGIGLRVTACAIGQASAAIFASHAPGRSRADLAAVSERLEAWLAGSGERPHWPRLEALDEARAYPARHDAILLPWKAALDALPSPDTPR